MNKIIKKKVLAYIVRNEELLVFTQRGFPEAGVQVPGGTVDPGEEIGDAILRELFEETDVSFSDKQILKMLGVQNYHRQDLNEINERYYYLVDGSQLLDHWDHQVVSDGLDNGIIFQHCFIDKIRAKQMLTGQMNYFL